MKTRWMHLIAGVTMFVLCISVCTTTVNADLVWEDNFDDGTYEPEWTTFGYENITSPVKIEGNFSAASGMLTVLDDDANVARHNSTTNVGMWSFDMFAPDADEGTFYIDFMSNGASLAVEGNMSWVTVGVWFGGGRFIVEEGIGDSYIPLANMYVDPLQGWHHIDVSRTSEGRFRVFLNGTLRADFTSTVTNSTYLQVWCHNVTGAAIDNLVVDDDPYKPLSTTTTTPTPFDPLLIGLFGGIGVGVVLIAIVVLRRR